MLFTNKEVVFNSSYRVIYSLRPTPSQESLIRVVSGEEVAESEQDFTNDLHLTDDLLGLGVWQASLYLCKYLAANEELCRGRKVVELGAGVGVPGLLAAHMDASYVTLTDHDKQVLHLLSKNLLDNKLDNCTVEPLNWLQDVPPSLGQYDLVLASDVMYLCRDAEPLAHVMSHVTRDDGLVLMAHQIRKSVSLHKASGVVVEDVCDEPLENFKRHMAQRGFHILEVSSVEEKGARLVLLGLSKSEARLQQLR